MFGSERIDFKDLPLYEMSSQANLLPSDSSYREDINELKRGRVE